MEQCKLLITGGSGFIGSHFIEFLIKENPQISILNIDIKEPIIENHNKFWEKCDIKDFESLKKIFDDFKPNYVLHLAAKADTLGKSIDDFPDNTIGTENVVKLVKRYEKFIKRFIHTSTQFVVKPGIYPTEDTYFVPYTPYGESKAISEKIVRKYNLNTCWLIIRPTNVWGPYHPGFPDGLWKYVYKGLYIHPGYSKTRKFLCYVENCAFYIYKLMFEAKNNEVNGKVFYISDPPVDNYYWLNNISLMLTGKKVKRVPLILWKLLALFGDMLNKLNIPFPMRSDRLFRITVDECLPVEKTYILTGKAPITLEDAIKKTVNWLKVYYANRK